ncbi:MAG: NAD-dependent epimerase/dehydratase family protein, partial [Candidatus Marinimicrobia bacterium]|nr:NAD-dependent epimerase/dehydratase family protein [Candidatus Neomarinimicrobiota bacterium]
MTDKQQNKKIIVTGAAGFIGLHLAKSLLNDGYTVLGIDNMNDYYDPSLKQARLNQLTKYSEFSFAKIDIADLK